MYLAQANIAVFRWPLDDARMEPFTSRVQPINDLAERAEGFVWRYSESYRPRKIGSPWDKPLLFFNLSVWRDLESLRGFVRSPEHLQMVRDGAKWLEGVTGPSSAMWWINETDRPTVDDAIVALANKAIPPQSDILSFVELREHTVWQSVVAKDRPALSQLFTDDYVEITLSGKRVRKSQIVDESPQTDEISAYTIDSPEVIALANGTFLLSYHVTIDGTYCGEKILPRDRWATSIWRRDQGCWKCCFFQQSPWLIDSNSPVVP